MTPQRAQSKQYAVPDWRTDRSRPIAKRLPDNCPESIVGPLLSLDDIIERRYDPNVVDENGFNWGSQRICSVTARYLAYQLDGEVAGYFFDENPRATLGREQCRGHDFCLTSNWVLDYWGGVFASIPRDLPEHPLVLHRTDDHDLIEHYYGQEQYWNIRPITSFDNTPSENG